MHVFHGVRELIFRVAVVKQVVREYAVVTHNTCLQVVWVIAVVRIDSHYSLIRFVDFVPVLVEMAYPQIKPLFIRLRPWKGCVLCYLLAPCIILAF